MSDGRKRLSGAEYKKLAELKAKKERKVIEKTQKISSFFKKPDNCTCECKLSTSLINELETGETSNSVSKKTNATENSFQSPDDNCQVEEVIEISPNLDTDQLKEISQSSNEFDVTNFVNTPLVNVEVIKDPALWKVNNVTRDYVCKHGVEQDINNLNFEASKRLIGEQYRYLSPAFFKTKLVNGQEIKRSYLIYSESTGKLFCVPCQLFGGTTILAKEGFDDWKHGDSLKKHENSSEHKSCMLAMKTRARSSGSGNVSLQLFSQVEDEKLYWRNVLKRVVAVTQSLTSAGLPLRGDTEHFGPTNSNSGNFIMCLELVAKFDPFLAEHIARYGNPGQGYTSYLSSTTYQQFVQLMADKVTNIIVQEVKTAKYYSVVVDSSPDISNVDELAIIIRYVQQSGTPVERFLCFIPNVGHGSAALFEAVLDVLSKYNIDIQNCRGQSYDNASNMSGAYSGLQARIREVCPEAIYTPCSAHSLNLVGKHAAECCQESTHYFELLQGLYVFFSSSTKRWEVLQKELNRKENLSLKSLSNTRWSARDDACKSLNKDWKEVCEALKVIANDETEKTVTRNEASGYLEKLSLLETAFLSVLWGDVLDRFNIASKTLQGTNVNIHTITNVYNSLCGYVSSLRSDFDMYENRALVMSVVCEYEDTSNKRKKKIKLQAGETRDHEVVLSGRTKFKTDTYLVIIDRLIAEMTKRKQVYDELCARFELLTSGIDWQREKITESARKLCSVYKRDLPDCETFTNECVHFFGFLKSADKEPPQSFVELVQLVYDTGLQELYPYIDIALRLFLTTPASNCSAERSFSVMKRVNNYLRSSQSHERLNSMAVLTIESSITKQLNYDDLIDSFAQSKSRRKKC